MDKEIMIIAGESSGDLHASLLIKNLKEINPEIKISGLGGKLMEEAGAHIYYDLTEIAVIGFFEVLKNLPKFKAAFRLFLNKIDQRRPEAVILIDYPGFNLKIAREIKKRNIPIIYYISPQIWAWGRNRIKVIKKLIDKIIVVFKFEEDLYKQEMMDVYFAGHPLVDIVKTTKSKEEVMSDYNLSSSHCLVTLMPGSRENEVKKNLPLMLKTALNIQKKLKKVQFIIIQSPALRAAKYYKYLDNQAIRARVIKEDTYNLLKASSFAIICSGTATLESALLKTPFVIVYRISFLSWLLIRHLIKIPYIGLVNIVRGKKIIPEFVQHEAKPKRIAGFIIECLKDAERIKNMKEELNEVEKLLGPPEASKRAAQAVIDFLNRS
jgi:lipid-A-disaccharide synthase